MFHYSAGVRRFLPFSQFETPDQLPVGPLLGPPAVPSRPLSASLPLSYSLFFLSFFFYPSSAALYHFVSVSRDAATGSSPKSRRKGRKRRRRREEPTIASRAPFEPRSYQPECRLDSMSTSTLAKLDGLLLRLADAAPLKTHKYFRVAVPQALTGQTLVQTLQEILSLDDTTDALHLATLLLHYGYVFPVIEQSNQVKDDNTLYRIQLPYFWPSHSQQTDNVEYAIYLNKRLMRNEQKHGLDEHEVEAYNKLAELLGHQWGFITVQAEMQLKMQKERKKSEKVVFDSEERAFWRQRQPGQPNCLEQPISKVERRIRKMNLQGHRQRVERLKLALKTKPWLKAMKASESQVVWCEQFQDYDPFITPSQPPNPWITDDTSLWTLNTDIVEVPTERRVKRWGLSVQELVKDVIGRQVCGFFWFIFFLGFGDFFGIGILIGEYSLLDRCSRHQICSQQSSGRESSENPRRIFGFGISMSSECGLENSGGNSETAQRSQCRSTSCFPHRRRARLYAHEQRFISTIYSLTNLQRSSERRSTTRQIEDIHHTKIQTAALKEEPANTVDYQRRRIRNFAGSRRLGWSNLVFNQKRIPPTAKHKSSRDDNSHPAISLPKQLSSDSLPLKSTTSKEPSRHR